MAAATLILALLAQPDLFKPIPGEITTQDAGTPAAKPEIKTDSSSSSRVAGVPRKAYTILEQVLANQGEPPQGYRGGRTFYNDGRGGGQRLPGNTTYREYDLNPYRPGQNRGAERLVIGSDGSAWYTADHYQTFVQIR